ncbi:MAG: hypothetical protein A2X86_12900 [Bdellovibrionales bacterium GWA2_49_15]|nr:MAG: hypothetical protein A2X86_12900 [Bdellovibrionales bacterium GWA2_49_15]HAZ13883.1 hypothetical protein [Bdellovibrionales bacterium]
MYSLMRSFVIVLSLSFLLVSCGSIENDSVSSKISSVDRDAVKKTGNEKFSDRKGILKERFNRRDRY